MNNKLYQFKVDIANAINAITEVREDRIEVDGNNKAAANELSQLFIDIGIGGEITGPFLTDNQQTPTVYFIEKYI